MKKFRVDICISIIIILSISFHIQSAKIKTRTLTELAALDCCVLKDSGTSDLENCQTINLFVCNSTKNAYFPEYCDTLLPICEYNVPSTQFLERLANNTNFITTSLKALLNVHYQYRYARLSNSGCNETYGGARAQQSTVCTSYLAEPLSCCAPTNINGPNLCTALTKLCLENNTDCSQLESIIAQNCPSDREEYLVWTATNGVLERYFRASVPTSGREVCNLNFLNTNLSAINDCYIHPSNSATSSVSPTVSPSASPSASLTKNYIPPPSASSTPVNFISQNNNTTNNVADVWYYFVIGGAVLLIFCGAVNKRRIHRILKRKKNKNIDAENMNTIDNAVRKNNQNVITEKNIIQSNSFYPTGEHQQQQQQQQPQQLSQIQVTSNIPHQYQPQYGIEMQQQQQMMMMQQQQQQQQQMMMMQQQQQQQRYFPTQQIPQNYDMNPQYLQTNTNDGLSGEYNTDGFNQNNGLYSQSSFNRPQALWGQGEDQ